MTLYDGNKKIHHYFPKVNHTIPCYEDYDETFDSMIIEDRHNIPYMNDFPSKDFYETYYFD